MSGAARCRICPPRRPRRGPTRRQMPHLPPAPSAPRTDSPPDAASAPHAVRAADRLATRCRICPPRRPRRGPARRQMRHLPPAPSAPRTDSPPDAASAPRDVRAADRLATRCRICPPRRPRRGPTRRQMRHLPPAPSVAMSGLGAGCVPLGMTTFRPLPTRPPRGGTVTYQGVAQWVARALRKREVAGSSPATLTINELHPRRSHPSA